MNLRLRLIVAFFVLSVVPLGAVTFYTYASNAAALREAAGHEAESLAGDLTQRMQLVTTEISERVEHVMNVQREADGGTAEPAAKTVVAVAPAKPSPRPKPKPTSTPSDAASAATASAQDTVAQALGDVAMLLNNIEVRGMRPPGGGRGPLPPGVPAEARGGSGGPGGPPGFDRGFRGDRNRRADAAGAPPAPLPPVSPSAPSATPAPAAVPSPAAPPRTPVPPTVAPPAITDAAPGPPPDLSPASPPGRTGRRLDRNPERGAAPRTRIPAGGIVDHPPEAVGRANGVPPGPPPPPGGEGAEKGRILFDMMPIRREMMEQLVGSTEDWQKLSPEERQKVIGEVNQRMLGIVQGIQLGAAELQKKVSEAQRVADEKARAAEMAAASQRTAAIRNRPAGEAAKAARAATSASVTSAISESTTVGTSGPMRRKIALSGNRLDVTMERDGTVVREANAEVNLPNLLATVFTTTRRARGEVPFAFSKDGRLFTPTDEDRKKIESLGAVVKADAPSGTTVLPDWIVVTTSDPAGSGLKFGIARPVGESLNELRRAGARNAGLGLACIGLALIGIVPLSSHLTRNLSKLNDGVHRIAEGDYSARVQVGSNDEIGRLARAFNQMAEDVERNQHAVVEQERIRRELELGRQIQHDMLPHGPLRLGLTEIKGVSVPAREVGGDFFNYFALSDGELALLVGDVSGKGVGAALLMANIQASLRTRLALGQNLAAIAREIDLDIEGNTPGPVYATLFVGMLNPGTRLLRYVNAGHNPQFVLRRDGRLEEMSSSGLPVGLLAGHGYTETRVELEAGDLLFFYTDGCVEAENEKGEMFGAERLEALLRTSAGAEDLLARVESAVKSFRGTAEPFDDATMMVVRVG
jgi:serine phosphatase RsbU (regulator of sigma subunit)